MPLLFFDFGRSDSGRDIGYEISTRMWPSLALAVPTFLLGLIVMVAWSLLVVLFAERGWRRQPLGSLSF